MLKAECTRHDLHFKQPAGTSRGVLLQKPSWLVRVFDDEQPAAVGVGEVSIIPGLSFDDRPSLPAKLSEVVAQFNFHHHIDFEALVEWPSIRFGFETAIRDFRNGGKRELFSSNFTSGNEGIPINGLIWMGDVDFMSQQIEKKLLEGYRCLKMKIGAIGFQQELALLRGIRNRFSPDVLELRVDANGAFEKENVWACLDELASLHIHSIEQPVKAGHWELMGDVCRNSPIAVALDEELIGISSMVEMERVVTTIKPQYLILKPGLIGGFDTCEAWLSIAKRYGIGWWATSALEGNVGLNAIAQWTFMQQVTMPQGLGTGQLFTNNVQSPLEIRQGQLFYNPAIGWGV